MIGSRNGCHGDTQSYGSDFCTIQEVGTEETDGSEEAEKVYKECGSDRCTIVVVGERSCDGKSDHAQSHTTSRDHKADTATEAIDTEEGNETRQELPGQSTSRQKLGVIGAHTETLLEDGRGVDGDEVGTGHLLEELEQDTETETVGELVFTHAEQILERGSLSRGVLERELDTDAFSFDLGGVDWKTLKSSQVLASFLATVLGEKPAGGFGEEPNRAQNDDREEQSDGDRRTPGDGSSLECEESEVDPGLESVTERNEHTVENNVLTTVLGG